MNKEQGEKLIKEFIKDDEAICHLRNFSGNWNALMAVVEKILTIHYGWKGIYNEFDDCPYLRTFGMRDKEGKYMVRINANTLHSADTLIEATWLAVIDFIQYNNQKQ